MSGVGGYPADRSGSVAPPKVATLTFVFLQHASTVDGSLVLELYESAHFKVISLGNIGTLIGKSFVGLCF